MENMFILFVCLISFLQVSCLTFIFAIQLFICLSLFIFLLISPAILLFLQFILPFTFLFLFTSLVFVHISLPLDSLGRIFGLHIKLSEGGFLEPSLTTGFCSLLLNHINFMIPSLTVTECISSFTWCKKKIFKRIQLSFLHINTIFSKEGFNSLDIKRLFKKKDSISSFSRCIFSFQFSLISIPSLAVAGCVSPFSLLFVCFFHFSLKKSQSSASPSASPLRVVSRHFHFYLLFFSLQF